MRSRETKIAIIDHVGAKAGMDYYSGSLAKGFANEDVKCLVFSNFTIQEEHVYCFPYFIHHTSSKIKKATNHFWAYYSVIKRMKKEKCTVAIVHVFSYAPKDYWALKILKRFGIKIIAIIHDVESFGDEGSIQVQSEIFKKLTQALIVHNKFSYNTIRQKCDDEVMKKVSIIPHGNFNQLARASQISKEQARAKLNLSPDDYYLLFFGQIKSEKGLDILLNALPECSKNVKLIIAGKPWKNDFENYEAQINALQIQERVIKHIRFITDEERDLFFRAADLLVLPYKQIYQSGVMLMGIAYNLPILASDLEAMKEIILDDQTGYLFEHENQNALASKINFITSNTERSKAITKNAWEYCHLNHNWHNIAKSFLQIASDIS